MSQALPLVARGHSRAAVEWLRSAIAERDLSAARKAGEELGRVMDIRRRLFDEGRADTPGLGAWDVHVRLLLGGCDRVLKDAFAEGYYCDTLT